MNLRWLLRATLWARRPPSTARVKLVLGVVALCLLLVAAERWIGLPVPEGFTGRSPRP